MTDNLSRVQRSYCMSRVRSRDTAPERTLRSALHACGLRFRTHVRTLPGTPDIVFARARVAVFVDGRFWHGYRFPAWKADLSDFWSRKIEANRRRDRRNSARLRRRGWTVIRVWDHRIRTTPEDCVRRITDALHHRGAARKIDRTSDSLTRRPLTESSTGKRRPSRTARRG